MKLLKWIKYIFNVKTKITLPAAFNTEHPEAYIFDYEGDENEICQITMGYWDFLSWNSRVKDKIKNVRTVSNFWIAKK